VLVGSVFIITLEVSMLYAKPAELPCPAPLTLGRAQWRFDDQR